QSMKLFVISIYAQWLILKKFIISEGLVKNQVKYVLLSTSISFIGGSTTYPLCFNVSFYPMGVYAAFIYVPVITYAIFKHHLMDFNIVIRKSLVYSLMTGALTGIYLVLVTQGARVLQNVFGASTLTISIVAACLITSCLLPL